MKRFVMLLAALSALVVALAACNGEDVIADLTEDEAPADVDDDGYDIGDQPADAAARFEEPTGGDTVSSPVRVVMVADGVDIVAADAPAAGEAHFHVLVDIGCAEEGEFFPGPSEEAEADGYHHFGDGSTEAELEFEPGTYELCLQLGDGVHQAFGTTDQIEITVE